MPKVSAVRRGIHIVDPTPQAKHLTLCEQTELHPGDDAVSVTRAKVATCPQCTSMLQYLPEMKRAAQAKVS